MYIRNLILKSDSELLKKLIFAHLLVIPMKNYLQWHKHTTYEKKWTLQILTKIENSDTSFLFFLYFRDLIFDFDTNHVKQFLFVHLLVAHKKKPSVARAHIYFNLSLIFFFARNKILNVGILLFLVLRKLVFQILTLTNVNIYSFCNFRLYSEKNNLLRRGYAFFL